MPMITSHKLQRGLTLIEVLIATVILAFGLLGIAGMQLSGIRATQGSYLRSQAVAVLNDFSEKIRANPLGARSGQYAKYDSLSYNCATATVPAVCSKEYGMSADPSACNDGNAKTSNGKALADYDKYVLACGIPGSGGTRAPATQISNILPSGQLLVTCWATTSSAIPFGLDATAAQCTPGSRLQVRVLWQDRAGIQQFSAAAAAASAAASNTVGLQVIGQSLDMWIQP